VKSATVLWWVCICVAVLLVASYWDHRNAVARLRRMGRLADWAEVRPHLEAGEGVLIVLVAGVWSRTFWWTARRIEDEEVGEALTTYAIRVFPPLSLRSRARLQSAFPALRVIERHGVIQTLSQAGHRGRRGAGP